MTFTPIVGTLAYLVRERSDTLAGERGGDDNSAAVSEASALALSESACNSEVLMIRRNARRDDDHFNKVNGIGGKVEADEDVLSGLLREIEEEAGVLATDITLRAVITFTDFGPKREQWLVFAYLVTDWSGELLEANPEGQLEWVSKSRLLDACSSDPQVASAADLPMWDGDKYFVPLIFDGDPTVVNGVMAYDGAQPKSWKFHRL